MEDRRDRPRIRRIEIEEETVPSPLQGDPALRERVRSLAVVSRIAAPSPAAIGLVGLLALHYLLFRFMAPRAASGEIHPLSLLLAGAKSGPLLAEGQWWRLFAAPWLHASWAHLLVNLAGLLLLGQVVANALGSGRMLLIFSLGGAASFLVSSWSSPAASVGASGAVHALMGSLLAFGALHGRRIPRPGRPFLLAGAGLFLGVTLLGQILDPHSDRLAHLGGLGTGVLLGGLLGRDPRLFRGGAERRSWPLGLLVVASVSLALTSGVMGLAGLTSLPTLPNPGLREVRVPGLRIPLPSRWEAGRMRQDQCLTPIPPGTSWAPSPGETLCLRDAFGSVLLLGPPSSVTPSVVVDPSLTGVGGLRTMLREERGDVLRRWLVLSPQWAVSVTAYRIIAPAYDSLLEEVLEGIRLPP